MPKENDEMDVRITQLDEKNVYSQKKQWFQEVSMPKGRRLINLTLVNITQGEKK
ncbi:hypothetical protein QW180_31210 [Vibrio sinaloensis]|nr:hypothetical protein [Vibrio sinaloensis]